MVVVSLILLVSGLPLEWLPSTATWSAADLPGLLLAIGCLVAAMLPLDLLGGYVLPNRARPGTISAGAFLQAWIRGVAVQATCFTLTALAILAMGRWLGLPGAAVAVLAVAGLLIAFQLSISQLAASLPKHAADSPALDAAVAEACQQTADWGWQPMPIVILDHHDRGFTGGIVGLPGRESIVLPSATVHRLTPEQLAVALARRLEAIQSGSRTRGMILALAWVVGGFVLAVLVPGAGVTSVGGLVMTCLGFTLWTFLGLLTLPTLSRQASYAIDRNVIDHGAAPQTFYETVKTLDRVQDDEPTRGPWIETIFHPVPSVENRRSDATRGTPIAWHAARMTLFVSWAGLGILVRAVHCNVGRPELWSMLPTD
jgi:hypothetical protein